MGAAIGDVLPLAVGIAISPIPIIAAILMLLSPHAVSTSVGFMLGWIGGVVVAVVIFTLLSAILPAKDPSATHPLVGAVQLLLGVLLLLIALRQWRSRPAHGEEAKLPKWMGAIDSMNTTRAAVLGFVLSAANPKNLMMAISAGVSIGAASLAGWQSLIVIVIFVVIACCSIAGPVLAFLMAAEKLRTPLDSLRAWLSQNNATIMAIVMLVLAVVVIGKGLRQF